MRILDSLIEAEGAVSAVEVRGISPDFWIWVCKVVSLLCFGVAGFSLLKFWV
jgi:hypothetical protein